MPHRLLNLLAFLFMAFLLLWGMWARVHITPMYEDVLEANVLTHTHKGSRYLYVRSDYKLNDLKKYLYRQKLLLDTGSFARLARHVGYAKALIPGRYEVKDGMNNLELLALLASGRQDKLKLRLESIRFKNEFAHTCSQYLEADEKDILQLLSDKHFLAQYHARPENVMCHMLGRTYSFYWNTSAKALLEKLLADDEDFWTTDRMDKAREMGLKPDEVVTLASIVQEETLKRDEAPTVAGVYLNRLHKGMRLQADPTLKYVLLQRNPNRQVKRLYQYYFNIPSPYNTYLNAGLPPGPVALASGWAIDAVLNAEKHNYYYFVAKDDFSGYHNFSVTYKEHEENSRKYQEELDRRNIH